MDLVRILLQYAASRGIDLNAGGLARHESDDPAARIPIERLSVIWNEIVRCSGDENFGLHLGEAAESLSSGGILFSVMMNCATLESALEKQARYHNLATDFVHLRLYHEDAYAHYVWDTVDMAIPLDRHYTEAVFCGLVFPLRRLTQGNVQPVEIRFKHSSPEDTAEHRRIFACPLKFGCTQNELLLCHEDLARPVFQANVQLLGSLEQFAQEMLDQLYPPDTWADQVAHLIKKSLLQGEKPTLDSVAARLALSTRQLQNKLKEEGIVYQTLLDQIRKEIALNYLGQPQVTVCDIAFLLGYSEQSAFNHAFKRWTGLTPGQCRATHNLDTPSIA